MSMPLGFSLNTQNRLIEKISDTVALSRAFSDSIIFIEQLQPPTNNNNQKRTPSITDASVTFHLDGNRNLLACVGLLIRILHAYFIIRFILG